MKLQHILAIAATPLLLAFIAYRLYAWNNYVKDRKPERNKMKKFVEKIERTKKVDKG